MKRSFLLKHSLLVALALVMVMALLTVSAVGAFEGRSGDVVVISTDEVIEDDLYVLAESFTLNGTVEGDLIVAGREIKINGTVEGDLLAVGQSVTINGKVQDDARISGYALFLGGKIGDDLLGGGFSLETRTESLVEGDLLFGGYQGLLAGTILGDLNIGGGAVKLAGEIEGDVVVDVSGSEPGERMPLGFPFAPGMPTVPTVASGLTLADQVEIGGNLQYTANAEADIPSGAIAGKTDFIPYVSSEKAEEKVSPLMLVGLWLFEQLQRLITLLLLGALLIWLLPQWTRRVADMAEQQPLASFGGGVIGLAVFVLGMLLLIAVLGLLVILLGVITLGELAGLMASLGGLLVGALGLIFKVTWSYITKIIVSLMLGRLILSRLAPKYAENRWWSLIAGYLALGARNRDPHLGLAGGLGHGVVGIGRYLTLGAGVVAETPRCRTFSDAFNRGGCATFS